MRDTIRIGLTALRLSVAGPVLAGSLADGEAAWNRGDYATALQVLRPLAEQGVAPAQAILGVMYDNGQGVPRDDATAVAWFRKAADQGLAHAEYDLGLKYSRDGACRAMTRPRCHGSRRPPITVIPRPCIGLVTPLNLERAQ